MEEIDKLIYILEISIEKNGEKPLTNKHLLNIVKMLKRKLETEEEKNIELNNDDHYWGH